MDNYYLPSEIKLKEKSRLHELLKIGADKIYRHISKVWFDNNLITIDLPIYCLEKWPDIFLELRDVELIQRFCENHYKRNNRLKNKITQLIANSDLCVFATLTFRDDVLESTDVKTRRTYVSRFLKEHSKNYIANIDFGKENEREHYHALIDCKIANDKWIYGAINFEKIRAHSNPLRLAKYINKLTYHAIKDTTKSNRIIYSRKN